jgi:8-oxo-dGTP pyrophosphatase MutT (NUDIX family)
MSLLEELRCRLLQLPPDLSAHDDYDLAPELKPGSFGAIKAAVLLPIVARKEPALLFTRRTEHLARHSGQISFPGGRREDGDVSLVETALRETLEETGIGASYVTVVGYLNRYLTGTGFDIQPVVGLIAEGFSLAPDPREVASVFEVPLSFLLDPANRRRETRHIAGRERRFFAITYQEHEIWGATAAIIVDLADRLDGISLGHED